MNESLILILTLLVPGLPLLGFLINGLLLKNTKGNLPGHLSTLMVALSFVSSIVLFAQLHETPTDVHLAQWFHIGDWEIDFAFRLDQLSLTMLLIVTGVGTLIHVYSIGYMHDDEAFPKYFSYLNLFVFFMLMLVMGDSLMLMFIGWEGVGLCSYLLIGYWFKKNEYNSAAKKAFVMNRIGDVGFVLAMFFILQVFGTLNFQGILAQLKDGNMPAAASVGVITTITLLLFFAATGKSAQIPLYTWLPDAMAGPTPVSALIHAATMVTAGIYMILRLSGLFILAPITMEVILVIGTATCLLGALIGLRQNDIKKVLAYSTVSQLGLMFAAVGAGAFNSAFFHLTTHAFFKALLFLAAGSVIHALSGEQDIRKMGGLAKKIPVTFITFLLGSLAISGIPPFSGFFSKDEILANVYGHNPVIWGILQLSSLLTAFYMFRLVFLVFYKQFRGDAHTASHIHESSILITFVLISLTVLSVFGGFIGMPPIFGVDNALEHFLAPVFAQANAMKEAAHLDHTMEWILMGIATVGAIIMIFVARAIYITKGIVPAGDEVPRKGLTKLIEEKFYIDEIYTWTIRKPLDWMSQTVYRFVELKFIDAIVNGLGSITLWTGNIMRKSQTGNTGYYIFAMVIGIIIIFIIQYLVIQ